ncbi:MAG: glycosyltransferase family 4 protein [Candidatus Falkowbacteria bacterium]|nr:glycosyltransferase family 4 protein [Candidatus Falkowbacteria bacterium]
MKIIFIGQKGLPSLSGGVEKHVEELAVRLAGRGHEVMAYTRPHYTDPKLTDYKGVELVSLPSLKTKNLDAISHTFLACLDLFRQKADIIHFHSIGPSSLIWLARIIKPSAKIISTFHCQDYYHQKWNFFGRIYLKFGEWMSCHAADMTITVSESLQDYALKAYGVTTDYIPNGVPVADLKEANEITKLWNLNKDSYVLTVSRFVRHKGLHYLINAFRNTITDKKLVIVGEGAFTDDYVKELKALAKGDDRIIFTGAQHGDVLKELLSNAYLFVQPSESEGLSIALLEAMSYGKTALVSDIAENKEAIAKAGITFRSKDTTDLAIRLNELLLDPARVALLGEQAKQRAISEYNWENIVSATEETYAVVIASALTQNFKRRSIAARLSMLL